MQIHIENMQGNLSLYIAASKAHSRFRRIRPAEAIEEILKILFIFIALLAILRC